MIKVWMAFIYSGEDTELLGAYSSKEVAAGVVRNKLDRDFDEITNEDTVSFVVKGNPSHSQYLGQVFSLTVDQYVSINV